MKENNKQELSYFRLKLRSYMSEHHPERLHDTEFITARADMPDRERLDLSHGSPHILDHDMSFQWYFDGNAQQDARTQQYRYDTNLRKDNRPQDTGGYDCTHRQGAYCI